uniref:F-box domain-containing protein n=1 Tax=Oryza punctata TaxID=4537 RepID=A0A0E0LGK1_ORYPU
MTESTSLTMCAAAANTTVSSLGAASSSNSNLMDLPEDVVYEILARLPADPKLLMRLSLVCKEWKRIFSDPAFICRYRKLNRPPLLGFFVNDYSAGEVGDAAIFVAATTYFRPAREVFPPHAIVIDGRHGMLLLYDIEGDNLLVWNPITSAQFIRIPFPINPRGRHWTSSVLCWIPHCDHKQCQGESFQVVLISSARDRDCTTAAFYLSDDSAWEKHIHVHERLDLDQKISVVIGEHVYIPTIDSCSILEVGLRSKKMKIIMSPPPPLGKYTWSSTMLMTAEGGDHLRFTWVDKYTMYFWDWEGGSTTWSPRGAIKLENIPPINTVSAHPIGFLRGAILIEVAGHIFMVNIRTQETEEIFRGHGLSPEFRMTVPYHAYYAPGNYNHCGGAGAAGVDGLTDDLVAEILLRLRPSEPACLVRTLTVCKPWHRLLTDPVFLRSYRDFHGAPPLLGFLHNVVGGDHRRENRFVPVTASPVSPPDIRCPSWVALDCRHGRALLEEFPFSADFTVWHPMTGRRRRLSRPNLPYFKSSTAAVLCSAAECNHLDCRRGGPFLVVVVGIDESEQQNSWPWATVYSSDSDSWSPTTFDYHNLNNLNLTPNCDIDRKPAALVGDALHFALAEGSGILKYNMGECSLSRIHPPVVYKGVIVVMAMKGNQLGLAGMEGSILSMWSSDVSLDGGVRWEKNRVFKLESLLPSIDCTDPVKCELAEPAPIGFVDGADIVFVRTDAGVFMIELKPMCVRKVCEREYFKAVFPYTSFYTPGVHLQQNLVQGLKAETERPCALMRLFLTI